MMGRTRFASGLGTSRGAQIRSFGSIAAMLAGGLLAVGVAWAVDTRVATWVVSDTASRAVTAIESELLTTPALDSVAAIAMDTDPESTSTLIAQLADQLDPRLDAFRDSGAGILSVRIYGRDGAVLYADQAELRGQKVLPSRAPRLAAALAGTLNTRFLAPTASDDGRLSGRYSEVLDIYAPLMRDDQTVGVVEVYSNLMPLYAARFMSWATVIGAAVLILLWYIRGRQTEQEVHVDQLTRQAYYDPLTGLANRALFRDRLAQAFDRVANRGGHLAVLFADLDRFKAVNDTLGHSAGDQLLAIVADRLSLCVRPGDTVARLGGDEFTVLLEGIRDIEDATHVAERMLSALRSPFTLGSETARVAGSVGIALNTPAHATPDELLRDADVALYRAKAAGKNRYAVFDKATDQPSIERMDLELDLRVALAQRELRVYFQPIVELSSGRVVELEALVRWLHPRRGLISPAAFVPLAEETGLIGSIGRWVLEEACRQVQAWQSTHPWSQPLLVSVNLSARQFQDPGFAAMVQAALLATGFEPSRLKLEITESMAMHDTETAANVLRQLKALGIQLVMDDFGTGYSSLAYLDRFPLDGLKIDRSFVASMGQRGDKRAIVQAIVAIAKSLRLSITAEGIETLDQYNVLRAQGCDFGQGFYFARPQPIEQLICAMQPLQRAA
jgi:diguanylate cyclase (GGDEF)-like protein